MLILKRTICPGTNIGQDTINLPSFLFASKNILVQIYGRNAPRTTKINLRVFLNLQYLRSNEFNEPSLFKRLYFMLILVKVIIV